MELQHPLKEKNEEIHKKLALAQLDKLAEKYPEKVAALKKLIDDSSENGERIFRQEYKNLRRQIRADQKNISKPAPEGKASLK